MRDRATFEEWYFDGAIPKASERSVNGEYKYMAAEQAWRTWQAATKLERDACAVLCEEHYREPQIMRATTIEEAPFRGAALDCAEMIRMRSNLEVSSGVTNDDKSA